MSAGSPNEFWNMFSAISPWLLAGISMFLNLFFALAGNKYRDDQSKQEKASNEIEVSLESEISNLEDKFQDKVVNLAKAFDVEFEHFASMYNADREHFRNEINFIKSEIKGLSQKINEITANQSSFSVSLAEFKVELNWLKQSNGRKD